MPIGLWGHIAPPRVRHVRHGVELEGPHKGEETLVLLTVRHHSLAFVRKVLKDRGRTASHVWLQCQPHESYDWTLVRGIARQLKVTCQIRHRRDLPPPGLDAGLPWRIGLVWRIPDECAEVAARCSHATWFGRGEFDGHETELAFRDFVVSDYDKDEVWVVEE